jgi:peptidyl-prolyl cis-trans isomerase SurA
MKYFVGIALLCGVFSAASAQVASHAPTAMKSMVINTTGTAAPPVIPTGSSMQVTGRPVVRVNGAVLTDRDLLREMFQLFPYARVHNGFPKSQEAEIRQGALAMIEYEELVYQEAERRKMTIPEARISKAVAEYRNKFQSDEEFNQYLKTEMGGSRQRFRQQIRRSMLIEALLKIEVTDKSNVSVPEAQAYYAKNPKSFSHGETFAFQTISIMPAENASAEVKQQARKKAEEILKQAKATKSFEEFGLLAEKVSEDDYRVNMGDHGPVERAKLPPEVIQRALAMQPGQVSDLIQAGTFYFCFRLNAHVPAGKVTFGEVRDRLMKDMKKAKNDELRAKLNKRLRQQAKVEEL